MTTDRDALDERLAALSDGLRAAAEDPTTERVDAARTRCQQLAELAEGDVTSVADDIETTLTTVMAMRDLVAGRVGDGRTALGDLHSWVERQDRVFATMADGLDELRAALPDTADTAGLASVARIPERVHEARLR